MNIDKWRVLKTTGPVYWTAYPPGQTSGALYTSWRAAYRYAYNCVYGTQKGTP